MYTFALSKLIISIFQHQTNMSSCNAPLVDTEKPYIDAMNKMTSTLCFSFNLLMITFVLLRHLYTVYPTLKQGMLNLLHLRRHVHELPKSVYIGSDKGIGLDCAVCISELEDGVEVRILPNCTHLFHVQCIDAWLQTHSTCPMCRRTSNNHWQFNMEEPDDRYQLDKIEARLMRAMCEFYFINLVFYKSILFL